MDSLNCSVLAFLLRNKKQERNLRKTSDVGDCATILFQFVPKSTHKSQNLNISLFMPNVFAPEIDQNFLLKKILRQLNKDYSQHRKK